MEICGFDQVRRGRGGEEQRGVWFRIYGLSSCGVHPVRRGREREV